MNTKIANTNYGLGVVIFDTKDYKDLTPGLWKPEYGPVTNIRWWDFLAEEAKLRNRVPKKFEYHYDKERNRI